MPFVRFLGCSCVVLLLSALPASAVVQSGSAWWRSAGNVYYYVPDGTHIKFCIADDVNNMDAWYGRGGPGSCYETVISSGSYFSLTLPNNHYWYAFAWYDPAYIGTDSAPAFVGDPSGTTATRFWIGIGPIPGLNVYATVRPLPPQAVYPANGQQSVPTSFTLKWTNGLNADRNWPGVWPVYYDIYGNGWGAPEQLVVANATCNPDYQGTCQYAFNNLTSSALFYWRIVAKMNCGTWPYNPYYTQSSAQFSFTTLTDPNATVSFVAANNVNYLSATNGGGYDLHAYGTGRGPNESFRVIDLNGGDLISGDQVALQMNANGTWYVVAAGGGGGAVNVNSWFVSSAETFTIEKLSGTPGTRILNPDRVAFRTSNGHYIQATNGGGSTTNAVPTSPGIYGAFIFAVN